MSKDFEQAYKELAQNEIPDLWDRIEAGIESRSTPTDGRVSDMQDELKAPFSLQEDPEESRLHELDENVIRKKKGLFYYRRYAGMAAAVICAAIIIPAVAVIHHYTGLTLSKNMSGSGQMTEEIDMAAEEAAEEESMADTTADTAMLPGTEEAAVESAAADAEAVSEDSAPWEAGEGSGELSDEEEEQLPEKQSENSAASGAIKAESAEEDSMMDAAADQVSGDKSSGLEEGNRDSGQAAADTGAVKEEQKKLSDLTSAREEMQAVEISDGTVFEHVIIHVEASEKISVNEVPGTLYTAIVEKGPLELLQDGGTLKIYLPVHSSIALAEKEEYDVDIIYQEKEEYPFGIQKYYKRIEK